MFFKNALNNLYNISLVSVSTIFCLLILEFVVRIISPPSPYHPFLPLIPNNKMELNVNIKGLSPVAIHSTNKWGMRGDEPPPDWEDTYTVVAIGGSTTQCFYLDDRKTWPYLLQGRLKKVRPKVWVGNGGLDGHSTRGHILFMNEVIPKIKPDVVVLLVGVNDLGLSISEDRLVYGSPFDKLNWKYKILANIRLAQILYQWKIALSGKAFVVKARHENYVPRPLREQRVSLPKDLKTLLPQLGEYRENIKRIIETGRLNNVKTVFLTQPMLFADTEYWRGVEGEFYWIKETKGKLSAAAYWELLDIYNKELLDICSEQKVECFDLASAVAHSDLYFYDSVHFTEKGAELVAEKVAGFLSYKNLIRSD